MADRNARADAARLHRALGQLALAQAHTRPPEINLAQHRIPRKQVSADSPTNIRSPPDNPTLLQEGLEGDPEPDEQQVKYHLHNSRSAGISQAALGGDPS